MSPLRYYVAYTKREQGSADGEAFTRHAPRNIKEGKALLPGGTWCLDTGARMVHTHRARQLRVWRHFPSPERALMGVIYGLDDSRAQYDGYLEEWRGKPPGYFPGDLERLGLCSRTLSALTLAGITTVDQLYRMTPAELARVRNVGRKSLNEIVPLVRRWRELKQGEVRP